MTHGISATAQMMVKIRLKYNMQLTVSYYKVLNVYKPTIAYKSGLLLQKYNFVVIK